jgi:hypothetical protein
LRVSQTPPCRPWCGSHGIPPNEIFSLSLWSKTECGRQIGSSSRDWKNCGNCKLCNQTEQSAAIYYSLAVSQNEFGSTSRNGLDSLMPTRRGGMNR